MFQRVISVCLLLVAFNLNAYAQEKSCSDQQNICLKLASKKNMPADEATKNCLARKNNCLKTGEWTFPDDRKVKLKKN